MRGFLLALLLVGALALPTDSAHADDPAAVCEGLAAEQALPILAQSYQFTPSGYGNAGFGPLIGAFGAGPAGVGALLMKGHADQVRLIPGGGQETGRRGGTESAALIAGFGAAAAAFPDKFYRAGTGTLIEKAEQGLKALAPDVVIFGATANRVGNTCNFAVPGLKNAVAMMGLDLKGISISSGSACSSGKVGPSHVLKAMGVPAELSECAMRLSVGWNSTQADIEVFLDGFSEVLERHRQRRGKAA